ncbi:MAG: glutamine amidotransferase-related protein [Bacillota bacterium]
MDQAGTRLIQQLLDRDIPMFGACYGAQQIAKTLGYQSLRRQLRK